MERASSKRICTDLNNVNSVYCLDTIVYCLEKLNLDNSTNAFNAVDGLNKLPYIIAQQGSSCQKCQSFTNSDTQEFIYKTVPKNLEEEESQTSQHYIALKSHCHCIINFVKLKELPKVECYQDQYNKGTFNNNSESALSFIYIILNSLVIEHVPVENIKDYIPVCDLFLLLCEHFEDSLWTSSQSLALSKKNMNLLLQIYNCEDIKELLLLKTFNDCKLDQCLLDCVMEEVLPRLRKDVWKRNPSRVSVYRICLFSITFPLLGDYVSYFLPPALTFLDDFEVKSRIIGVNCIQHIVSNCTKTELQWHGHGQVIYDALYHLTYGKEEHLTDILYPCLFAVLKIVEKVPVSENQIQKYGMYDKLLNQILTEMEMENSLEMRRKYSYHLLELLEIMGLTIIRHWKQLIVVIKSYLDVYDGPNETSRKNILHVLEVIIKEAWPRMTVHVFEIFQILLKFVYDITDGNSLTPKETQESLVELVTNILILLNKCTNYGLTDAKSRLDNSYLNEAIISILNKLERS